MNIFCHWDFFLILVLVQVANIAMSSYFYYYVQTKIFYLRKIDNTTNANLQYFVYNFYILTLNNFTSKKLFCNLESV